MKIEDDYKLDFDDVLIKCQRSAAASRKDVNLLRKFNFKYSERTLECVPVMCSNMYTTGTFAMGNILQKHKMITCLCKHYTLEELLEFYEANVDNMYVWYTLGINKADIEKLTQFLRVSKLFRPNICIDAANGHTDDFVEGCRKVRELVGHFPIIMAGNIGTPEMCAELILHGKVDIVKAGIGGGGTCETRRVTGCGYPQLSLADSCSNIAHGLGGRVCSDGGIKYVGDIAKVFGCSCDFAMCGEFFAGAEECNGEWIEEFQSSYGHWQHIRPDVSSPARKVKLQHFGMSSLHAHNLFNGGLGDYKAAEGEVRLVDYKGPVDGLANQICGGLRSACTHVGAASLRDLGKCTTFMKVRRWK